MRRFNLAKSVLTLLAILLFNTSFAQEDEQTVMVFSKTAGYRHKSIETGVSSIKELGKKHHFTVKATENSDVLVSNFKNCDVVIFLNTTGDIFNEAQEKAFKKFMAKGGGFVGIHAATDTEYEWPWYNKLVGAYFESHPHQQKATIKVENKEHPATSFLNDVWVKFDEWYNFKSINPEIKVLMSLDESSYKGGKNGENHPIAWFHKYKRGRVFYTGLGHTKESYTDPVFLKHVLGGINYAMGRD